VVRSCGGPAPKLTGVRSYVKRDGGTACARAPRRTLVCYLDPQGNALLTLCGAGTREALWEPHRALVAELRVSPYASHGGLLLRHGGGRE
jgi:hypothetical protein